MTSPFGNGNGGGQPTTVIPFPGQPQQQQGGGQPQQQQWQQAPQQPAFQQQPTQIVREASGISYDPRFMPAPAQAPQQQQQQPGPQPNIGPVQLSDATVLDGPSVPVELRGRTWAEMNRIYAGLRDIALQSQRQQQIPQPQPVPQPQAQPQGFFAPQQGQAPQGQQPQPGQSAGFSQADFLRDPRGQTLALVQGEIQNALRNVLGPALAPVLQQTNHLGMQSAMQTVAAEVGPARFQAMLPQIQQQLQGVAPQALTNPEMWRIAARSVAGEFALRGEGIPGTQAPQPTFGSPAGGYPVQQPQLQPIPGLGSFFSEAPGTGGAGGANGVVLSPAEKQAARMMEMSESDYAAWKGGVSRGA